MLIGNTTFPSLSITVSGPARSWSKPPTQLDIGTESSTCAPLNFSSSLGRDTMRFFLVPKLSMLEKESECYWLQNIFPEDLPSSQEHNPKTLPVSMLQNTVKWQITKEVSSLKQIQFWAWDFSQLEKSPFLQATWLCETELPGEIAVIAGDVWTPKIFIAFPPLKVMTFTAESGEGNARPLLDCSTSAALYGVNNIRWQSRQPCTGVYSAVVRATKLVRAHSHIFTKRDSTSHTHVLSVLHSHLYETQKKWNRLKSCPICPALLQN